MITSLFSTQVREAVKQITHFLRLVPSEETHELPLASCQNGITRAGDEVVDSCGRPWIISSLVFKRGDLLKIFGD